MYLRQKNKKEDIPSANTQQMFTVEVTLLKQDL